MQHAFAFIRKGLARACTAGALGVAVVVAAGTVAWSQQEGPTGRTGSSGATKPGASAPGGGAEMKRWMKEDFGIPEHESALNQEREEIELLEVQLASKKAAIRAAEVRVKYAKDQGEKEILQAELDAERAELLEPELLLKRARRRVKELEEAGAGGHPMAMGHPGMMGMGHPGMMGMGMMEHPGMGMGMGHPMMGHHWAMMREVQIENNLNLLRVAVERLEAEVDGLLDGSIKPSTKPAGCPTCETAKRPERPRIIPGRASHAPGARD